MSRILMYLLPFRRISFIWWGVSKFGTAAVSSHFNQSIAAYHNLGFLNSKLNLHYSLTIESGRGHSQCTNITSQRWMVNKQVGNSLNFLYRYLR